MLTCEQARALCEMSANKGGGSPGCMSFSLAELARAFQAPALEEELREYFTTFEATGDDRPIVDWCEKNFGRLYETFGLEGIDGVSHGFIILYGPGLRACASGSLVSKWLNRFWPF